MNTQTPLRALKGWKSHEERSEECDGCPNTFRLHSASSWTIEIVQWLQLRHEEKIGQFPDFVTEFLQLMVKACEWEAIEADRHSERCPRHILWKFQLHYWSQLSVAVRSHQDDQFLQKLHNRKKCVCWVPRVLSLFTEDKKVSHFSISSEDHSIQKRKSSEL